MKAFKGLVSIFIMYVAAFAVAIIFGTVGNSVF